MLVGSAWARITQRKLGVRPYLVELLRRRVQAVYLAITAFGVDPRVRRR